MRTKLIVLTAVSLAGLSATAYAATSMTSQFIVKMQISAQCLAATASELDFPTTGVLSTAVPATTTLTVQCTNLTPYNIGLDQGQNGSSVAARQMKGISTAALLNYNLFTDASHSVVWGNTIGTDTVAATGNGAAQNYTVYGQVPPQTPPAPDTYPDKVTITVTY
jgi:spore coat protein U-like protein